MKNKTYRFAAALAVLLALLVFVAPVGATTDDTEITQSDFINGYYNIQVSEDTTFTLTENVNGKIVIDQTFGNAPICHIKITSNEGVTLNGGIVIRPVNFDIQPITVTVEGMNIYMNASMGVSENDYDAASGSDVFAVHVPNEVSYGPYIKVNVIDNTITFDEDIFNSGKRASILHVNGGGLVHGSKLTGNTATGVTGAAFCFAGASALNPAPSNNGNAAEIPETIVISNNDVKITPIGSQYAAYGSESALVKIFHNGENVVPYTISKNTVEITTSQEWNIPVLRMVSVHATNLCYCHKNCADQMHTESSIKDCLHLFRSTSVLMEDNSITSGHSIFVLEPTSTNKDSTDFTVDRFKSFIVKNKVIVAEDIQGGVISVDPASCTSETQVTITATPTDDYYFDETSIKVTSNNGDSVNVENMQFTMPGESVTVTGLFKAKEIKITATPTEIGFDSVKVGYTQPDAKTVTITNDGNVPVEIIASISKNYVVEGVPETEIAVGESVDITVQPLSGLAVGNYADNLVITVDGTDKTLTIPVSFLVYQPSSGGSTKPVEEPEEPVEPETPVDPETPTEEPVAGETTVETEVTDGGEVELENPTTGGSAAAEEDEAKITGVVLPTGTDSEVTFVPVSEQPAPAGQEENTKKVFEINVPSYEKGKAAVIKFTMTVAELAADGKEAADVALWHFDEETGEWTKLVTSYTIVDGVVYFEAITEDFSPFAIVYEDEPVDEPVEEPETPESPAPVLGLLAALGAAVVLRRK